MSDDPKKKSDEPPQELKDLTNLMIHSKALEDSGHAPVAPEGSVMDEVPIEKIDDFESLEDYAVTNPPAELPADPAPNFSTESSESPPSATPEAPPTEISELPAESGSTDFPTSSAESSEPPAESGSTDFPTSPEGSAASDAFTMSEHSSSAESGSNTPETSDLATPSNDDFAPATAESAPSTGSEASNVGANEFGESFPGSSQNESLTVPEPLSAPAESFQALPSATTDLPSEMAVAPPPAASTPPASDSASPSSSIAPPAHFTAQPYPAEKPTQKPHGPATSPLEQIREFAEKEAPAKPNVPAAFPFSLSIAGELLPEEKEKLLDLITRENMGIREIDLEPQFQSGRVLVPRISEFAAILLVQALRGTRAKIKVGPSDQIFSTAETRDEASPTSGNQTISVKYISDLEHPAEHLPITTENHLPNQLCHLIDIVSASASLKSNSIEAETTAEYQEIVESLQREIKYKAFRKGAIAIINFKIQLNLITSPTHYRVTVLGTAVGKASPRPDHQPSV